MNGLSAVGFVENKKAWVPAFAGMSGFGIALALALACTPASADPAGDVMAALNAARTDPAGFAQRLAAEAAARDDGDAGARDDVAEAIAFLRRQPPLPPLARSAALEVVAAGYVAQQGPTGRVGHVGPDGSTPLDRITRAGLDLRAGGEDISYGERSPAEAVSQLIIDSGVPDRGHRRNIFDPDFVMAGAACGRHQVYRVMCVIDFGGTPRPR